MPVYAGNTLVVDFIADRVASGLEDEFVRADFERFFGTPLSAEGLDAVKNTHAGKIDAAAARLKSEMEASRISSKILALVEKLEVDTLRARDERDLKAQVLLVRELRGFMDLAMRSSGLRAKAGEVRVAQDVDVFGALEEIEREYPDLIEIKEPELLKSVLSGKAPIEPKVKDALPMGAEKSALDALSPKLPKKRKMIKNA